MNEDAELLRRYAEQKSQAAFAEFVQRYVDFVYGCALRRVGGDGHFADDVTQQVFLTAARNAAALARHPVVSGWLFLTTRNVAGQLVRAERRRHAREQQAYAMKQIDSSPDESVDWAKLRPVLDDALDALNDDDRQAVLLRFFEGKSFSEIGARLRIAENAARMRVDRALDKLGAALDRRGVRSTATALAAALAGQPAVAAPAGLAAASTAVAIAGAGSAGALATFMSMTKLQVVIGSAAAIAGISGYVSVARTNAGLEYQVAELRAQAAPIAAVRAENLQLRRTAAEVASYRNDGAALTQMGGEAAELKSRLQTVTRQQARLAAAAGEKVYDISTLDQLPSPQERTPPEYPFELRRAGVTGEATVDFIVDSEGNVRNARDVKSTDPEFAQAAVDAVSQWKFKPGRKGGRSVNTHMQVPIVFSLREDAPSSGPITPVEDQGAPKS